VSSSYKFSKSIVTEGSINPCNLFTLIILSVAHMRKIKHTLNRSTFCFCSLIYVIFRENIQAKVWSNLLAWRSVELFIGLGSVKLFNSLGIREVFVCLGIYTGDWTSGLLWSFLSLCQRIHWSGNLMSFLVVLKSDKFLLRQAYHWCGDTSILSLVWVSVKAFLVCASINNVWLAALLSTSTLNTTHCIRLKKTSEIIARI
jgi:hypothetical protein